jgi:hypothetical protein
MTTIDSMLEVRICISDADAQRKAMRLFYLAGLKKDKLFWFLPEPGYLVIRYSKNFDGLIKRAQKESGGKFEYSSWIEASEDVAEHALAFTKIMHECSVIAIEDNYDPFRLFERITHCMFLQFSEGFEKQYKKNALLESQVLSNIAIGRAEAIGYYERKHEETEAKSNENPAI